MTENLNTVSATARLFTPDTPLVLASGTELGPVDVAYETYGELNPQGISLVVAAARRGLHRSTLQQMNHTAWTSRCWRCQIS